MRVAGHECIDARGPWYLPNAMVCVPFLASWVGISTVLDTFVKDRYRTSLIGQADLLLRLIDGTQIEQRILLLFWCCQGRV